MRNTSLLALVMVTAFGAARLLSATPSAPTNLAVTVVGSTVTLSWTAASGGPTTYVLEAGLTPGSSNLADFATGSTATSFTAVTVPPGTYYVRVRARNAEGTSAPSNEIVVVVGGGCQVPNAPIGLTVSVSGNSVTLSWQAPSGGGAPASYVLEVGTAPGASDVLNAEIGLRLTISGNVPAGNYFARVRARNACGAGGASNEVGFSAGGPRSGFGGEWTGLTPDGVVLPSAECETEWDLFLNLSESNGRVTGTARFRARVTRGGPRCAPAGATIDLAVAGTTSGDSISFTATNQFGAADFTGTLSGNRISGSTLFRFGTPGGDFGTWTVTRTGG